MMLVPGLLLTRKETYRPILVVSGEGMYVCKTAMPTPEGAISFATNSKEVGSYKQWTYHRDCQKDAGDDRLGRLVETGEE